MQVPIKRNTAAILREEVFHRRRQEEEAERLAKLEQGAFDHQAFLQWEEEEREEALRRRYAACSCHCACMQNC